MTKYVCPGCDKDMIIAKKYGDSSTRSPSPDYKCVDCKLYYLTPHMDIEGSLYTINPFRIIAQGAFDYCYKIHKLKAFI